MVRLFFLAFLVFRTSFAPVHGQHVTCERSFYKLGCFQDRTWSRSMSKLLINDRSKSSQSQQIDWTNWEAYVHGLACRCAQSASQHGFTMFGLQNYGECWSGPESCDQYSLYGDSEMCIGKNFTMCNVNDEGECVGKANANFVYLLLEEPEKEVGI